MTKDSDNIYKVESEGLIVLALLGINPYIYNDIVFIYFRGLIVKDTLREEVPGAIRDCNKGGIRVIMVTGDNKVTAEVLAKECGIIPEGNDPYIVIEG